MAVSIPKLQHHLGRPSTPAAQRRALNRLAQNVDNVNGDMISTVNGISGAMTIVAGSGAGVVTSGSTITISATGGAVGAFHGTKLYGPSSSAGVGSVLNWANSAFDVDSLWGGAGTSKITIGTTGYYRLEAMLTDTPASSGNDSRYHDIFKNGSSLCSFKESVNFFGSALDTFYLTFTCALTSGDYLEVKPGTGWGVISASGASEATHFFGAYLLGT